ncbi:indolepyruvate oxidoreductase subunit beta family protein [Telluria beijingensis]|uniref:indolepyruvate oxidoreductase subunit beta family protein n=1 Tax=Telluria beijingensis TaxID=3068633 RepID=UPI002795AB15|nr:indolepyruvate oxidoreductase subunit beta family protein [Massilia sp. REN29]
MSENVTELRRPRAVRPIGLAILAMGGEGGGVLADWIVDMAEHDGYPAQSTSVPGVAQRTGTTVYYVEFHPERRDPHDLAARPVLALMPVAGDVDIVVASELMEMGRAVQRGLVTPGKTTLIASTNRVYSMTEKSSMGDGRVDPAPFLASAQAAARRFVHGDFSRLAEQSGSVISAALFGALAGIRALPFSREQFEDAIRRAGVGVESSLQAFARGYELAERGGEEAKAPVREPLGGGGLAIERLDERIRAGFPASASSILGPGVRRLADYQDAHYAASYLDLLQPVRDLDAASPEHGALLLKETARYLALWMSYEDTVRVADLKIRASRFERVRKEVQAKPNQVVHINEYFHPRIDEIADTLPAGLGRFLMRPGRLHELLGRMTAKGRVVRTTSLGGFLLLYLVSGMRRLRLSSLRHEREHAEIARWLECIVQHARSDYPLAVEIAQCQRLVKGYGDTHARGMRSFGKLMARLPQLASLPDGAARLRALREAALKDEEGKALDALLLDLDQPAPRLATGT